MTIRPLKPTDESGLTVLPSEHHPSRGSKERGKLLARVKNFCWVQWQHDLEPRTERDKNLLVDATTAYG